jgi:hypothetical protein
MAVPLVPRALSRRTLLRGAGAALALPWLDAMQPALRRTARPPLRAVFVFAPNGKKMDDWRPKAGDGQFELPFLLEPLAPWRSKLTVFRNLALDGGRAHGDGPGDHARSGASFLTGAHPKKTAGADIENGPSIDQALLPSLGAGSRLGSLELGLEPGRPAGNCDSGYSCAYTNNISWRDARTPLPKETDPRAVFARLFGDPDDVLAAESAQRTAARRKSILDAVRSDTARLTRSLGAADRGKLDEYLTALRDVEKRLGETSKAAPQVALPGELRAPTGEPAARLRLMYDLIALALASDAVRVVTFMLGNAGSNRGYKFLGVPEGHHDLSHHGGRADKLEQIRKINRYHVEGFAHFANTLATRDGFVLYGSGLADGNAHAHADLPILLLGGAAGRVRGNRIVHPPKETPLCDLYLAMLRWGGDQSASFGDSRGALSW